MIYYFSSADQMFIARGHHVAAYSKRVLNLCPVSFRRVSRTLGPA